MTRHAPAQTALLLCAFVLGTPPSAEERSLAPPLARDITLKEQAPLSSNEELIARLASVLTALTAKRAVAAAGARVARFPLEPQSERFTLYVPERAGDAGYGLIVFVPPWEDARLPLGWRAVLERFGFIFISAGRSGNNEPTLARRAPLALLAAYNITKMYPVDPAKILIAGFSGGSRVALRLALAYPDLFRGAILNAGSDPIGTAAVPLPAPELYRQFVSRSAIVFATGDRDQEQRMDDSLALHRLHDLCVRRAWSIGIPHGGHEVLDALDLARALDELLTRSRAATDDSGLACLDRLTADAEARASRIRDLVARGQQPQARRELVRLDNDLGRFAGTQVTELLSVVGPN